MSQPSTSNRSSLPRFSGLPRPSRLPVSRSTFDAPPTPQLPVAYRTSTLRATVSSGNNGGCDRESGKPDLLHGGPELQHGERQGLLQGSDSMRYQFRTTGVKQSSLEEHGQLDSQDDTTRRRPRPSLSDRTIETLAQIPPSPSPRRRKSSFFPSESPDRDFSRPSSSLSRARPSTSHGQRPTLPSTGPRSTSPIKRPANPTRSTNVTPNKTTPSTRAVSSYMPKSVPFNSTKTRSGLEGTPSKQSRSLPTGALQPAFINTVSKPSSKIATESKTYASRSSKPRPAVADAFKKPNLPRKTVGIMKDRVQRDISNHSTNSAASSTLSPTSRTSSQTSQASIATSVDEPLPQLKLTSSAALRETIAKAKAAHRKAAQSGSKASQKVQAPEEEIISAASIKVLLRKRVEMARTDGRLNIAALELTEIPDEVMAMYDLDTSEASGSAWYESVDVTRLIAADNRFEALSDDAFPDRSIEELRNSDDETKGTLFGGLETLDLHGNLLGALPPGFRQLNYLTILNLSKNKLGNDCLGTISQVKTLHELRLADNNLSGALPNDLGKLDNLRTLDVHNNDISDLPDSLRDLLHLRICNVAGNKLRSVPVESLRLLPIVELDISRNRLGGTLLPEGEEGFRSLQILDVCGNALASLTGLDSMTLQELRTLSVSENRLQALPNMSSCTSLTTLAAANNSLASFPDGMAALPNLRNIDFTGNNIKKLDENLAMMDNLSILNIANNPLRERRFLTMNTEDLKREMRNRLLPSESDQASQNLHDSEDITSREKSTPPKTWPVKPGGVLDQSSSSLSTVDTSDLEPLLSSSIRSVILDHNSLPAIPCSLSLLSLTLTSLDISHNRLTSSNYLTAAISLSNLRDINIASNTITSVESLAANLCAPRLESLNISYNRLTALPRLRKYFPVLTTVQASDNQVIDLPVDSVRGLHVCNVARNDIGHLEAQLGLLEAEGLRTLVVEGNRFRVPRREVVEGGTGKLLAWLRGRIPAS